MTAALAAPAQGREDPLLVVVEAAPAVGVDAAEIRRVVRAELGAPIVAPDEAERAPSRALVVAVNRERIAVSFRPGGDAPVSRAIPTPADHAGRLRAIAWLAGNVARDQVGPLLDETTVDLPYAGAADLAAPGTAAPSAPASPLPTEPPPLAHEPAAVVSAPAPVAATGSAWSVAAVVGPTFSPFGIGNGFNVEWRHPGLVMGAAWQLSIQHRPASGGTILGADVEGTSGDYDPQLLGVAGLVGREWRFRRWRVEGILGGGLEAARVISATFMASSTSAGFVAVTTATESSKPGLFARGALAAALPLSDSTELVAQLGAHASSVSFGGWYGTASLGLRYTLP